jgi:hypothetical protein
MKNENGSNSNSFRRNKLIEEMAPQRRAEALAQTQNDELSNISDVMQDAQAASELVSEVIENKSNQIISSIDRVDKSVQDVVAGTELTTDAVIESAAQNKAISEALSEKINKLSEMLGGKLSATVNKPVEGTSLQVIEDSLPEPVQENLPVPAPVQELLPPPDNKPDAEFVNDDKDSKEGKESDSKTLSDKIDALSKITEKGFKASVGVADRISGMLFKYTVTAAAEAAKLMAGLFLLVLGIDSIQVYFQYFMKQFEKSWVEFNNKFKEWGPLLEGLMTWAKNASAMFSEKNWLGLAEAIIRGMVNLTKNMAQLLMLGITKLISKILSTIPGMGDTAENIEAAGLMAYQQNTGATLDDEDQTKIAKYHDRRSAESLKAAQEMNDKFKDKPEALAQAEKYGTVSKENADQIRAGGIDTSFRDLPEEERLEYFKKRDKAQADIIRLTQTADNIMKPDETDKKNAAEAYAKIKEQLADPDLAKGGIEKSLDVKALLAKLDKSLEKFNTDEVKPQAPASAQEAQQARKIDAEMKARENAKYQNAQAPVQVNQQTNINKNSKTQYNMPPTSSTPAPGMRQATKVN